MDDGKEILKEIKGMKTSMFGKDGTGGLVDKIGLPDVYRRK